MPLLKPLLIALYLFSLSTIVLADEVNHVKTSEGSPITIEDEDGILNPADTGREMLTRKIEMGVIDSVTCSLGIATTKYDDHELSKKLTKLCAEAGYAKAMTWMSYLENNGLGGSKPNPVAATEWDRRAAEAGDTIGHYNYGLALIRGHGVSKDEALGRSHVDQAAQDGLEVAQRLQEVDYDLDEVTPDADSWQ